MFRKWYLEGKLDDLEVMLVTILGDDANSRIRRKIFGTDKWLMWVCKTFTKAEKIRSEIQELGGETRDTYDCFCCGKKLYDL